MMSARGRLGSADRLSATSLSQLASDASNRRLSLSQHDLSDTLNTLAARKPQSVKLGSFDNLLASKAPPIEGHPASNGTSKAASATPAASPGLAPKTNPQRPLTPDAHLTLAHLQCELSTALRAIVLDESESAIRQIALQSVYIQTIGELKAPTKVSKGSKELYRGGIEVLLAVLRLPDLEVVIGTAYLVGLLSEHLDTLQQRCPDMIGKAIIALSRAVGYFLPDDVRQSSDNMEAAVPELLEALRDWLMAVGDDADSYQIEIGHAITAIEAATGGFKTEAVQELNRLMIDLPSEDEVASPTERSLNAAGIDELASFAIQPEGHGFGVGGPGPAMSESSLNINPRQDEVRRSGKRKHRSSKRNKDHGPATPSTPNTGDSSPMTPKASAQGNIDFDREFIVSMAKAVYAQVIHHISYFPPVSGSVISTNLCDWSFDSEENKRLIADPRVQFFAFEEDIVLSMTERPDGGRIIIRNLGGKFSWDFSIMAPQQHVVGNLVPRRSTMSLQKPKSFRDPLDTAPSTRAASTSASEQTSLSGTARSSPTPATLEKEESSTDVFLTVPTDMVAMRSSAGKSARGHRLSMSVPQLSANSDTLDTCIDLPILDMGDSIRTPHALDSILDYLDTSEALDLAPIGSASSELDMDPIALRSPVKAPTDLDDGAATVKLAREEHQKRVDEAISSSIISYNHEPEARSSTPQQLGTKMTSFSNCRRWLEHLGLITWSAQGGLQPLDKSDKLIRELKNLDQSGMTREKHKIAVIYIGQHHSTKEEIIACPRGSLLFESFVAQLGWMVDLTTHQGYSGKLDTKEFAGCLLPYYATASREALFHVNTGLTPAAMAESLDMNVDAWDAETQKALYGKRWRHAGNDAVHVIWSEQDKLYSSDQLPTKFGDVSIVIYPMTNGLFRIQLLFKTQLPRLIGPLFDGAVVDATSLPHLVRATAINADRLLRLQKSPAPFLQTRSEYMAKFIKDLTISTTFEQFVASLLVPPEDTEPNITQEFRGRSPTSIGIPTRGTSEPPRSQRSASVAVVNSSGRRATLIRDDAISET
eukprot:TRINITY_DN5183_c0_g1_i1.p1 TRINITY_DN5183_c0_g1~~TRINITY_DN5183_c0_g1_i1.p1  ORF type:complete len:1047 (+),score=239.40 TRINITY_DN5183_c0_g1_i1:1-3141(+)